MSYDKYSRQNLHVRALDNMDITLMPPPTTAHDGPGKDPRLARLTPRELEICILHFIQGRSLILIGEWLGITERTMHFHLDNAVRKIPQLQALRVQALIKPKRPRMFHLSQLRPTERGPFNADDV